MNKTIIFAAVTKIIKCLEIYLKDVKYLYAENYKTILKKMKTTQRNVKLFCVFMD